MNICRSVECGSFKHAGHRFLACVLYCAVVSGWLVVNISDATAQKKPLPKKLPSAEKIVDNYLKAIGGKKAVAAINNATYDFTVQVNDSPVGTARLKRKSPGSERL